MARPLSPTAKAQAAIAALVLLLTLAAAPGGACAQADNATETLALGGDRLIFNGRRASATWTAAANASASGGNETSTSTLALRFGRLAELDAAGDVVRRVPSLARLNATSVTNGESFSQGEEMKQLRWSETTKLGRSKELRF